MTNRSMTTEPETTALPASIAQDVQRSMGAGPGVGRPRRSL